MLTYLFDLDGTLVDTDKIYKDVWNTLLKDYNIYVDTDFFNTFIKGKSDTIFVRYLINKITPEQLKIISINKDKLFIEYLNKSNMNILFDGVYNYIENIKDNKIAIVTSSNKKSAEFILKYTKIDKFIDILISSEDTINHKPHPDPYLKAIEILKTDKSDCVIFEDSLTGYLSAKKTGVKLICLYDNLKNTNDIKNLLEFKFTNYDNLINYDFLDYTNFTIDNYNDNIKQTLINYPIKEIIKNKKNLKTGYICDIDTYTIVYNDNNKDTLILKINNLDNELSKVATKLNMFNKEMYFYNNISKYIESIKIPKVYGSFESNNKIGILLENLHNYNGCFNMNLNNNIHLLLSVVKNIFLMHAKYYFETIDDIPPIMKSLQKINEINYYKELIHERFNKFINKCSTILSQKEINILKYINTNYDKILNESSEFPLSFCHGDLKSPNIFYLNNEIPYFLDWQYIHINKGVSDIVFLLVESIEFDINIVSIVEKFYYTLLIQNGKNISYEKYMIDFKNALCIFPFFVIVWFNSEDNDKLIDKCFPLKFLKNVLKYYDYYLDK